MKCMRGESDRAGERQCGERGALGLAGCGDVGKVRARRERLSEGAIELGIVSPEFVSVSPEFVSPGIRVPPEFVSPEFRAC